MPVPSPRNKILPARGNYADLAANIISLLDGEICYAIDQDQYYQNEEGVLIRVGATKAQGILADSSVQPLDNISVLTNDANYITAEEAPVQPSDLSTKADLVGGKVPNSQLPSIAITEYLGEVADEAGMLALNGEKGDWVIRTDTSSTWVITGDDATQSASWTELAHPGDLVTSVNGYQGAVVLSAGDVGAATEGQGALADSAVQRAGDNMTGDLTLGTDKITLDAATGSATFAGYVYCNRSVSSDGNSFFSAADASDSSKQKFFVGRVGTYIGDDVTFNSGSNEFSGNNITLNTDGSASFKGDVDINVVEDAVNKKVFTATGSTTDGSEGGTLTYRNDGACYWRNKDGVDKITFAADGSASFSGGDSHIKSSGRVQTNSYFESYRTEAGGAVLVGGIGTWDNQITANVSILADGSATFEGAVQANGSVAGDSCFITRLNGGSATSLITADGSAEFAGTLTSYPSGAAYAYKINNGNTNLGGLYKDTSSSRLLLGDGITTKIDLKGSDGTASFAGRVTVPELLSEDDNAYLAGDYDGGAILRLTHESSSASSEAIRITRVGNQSTDATIQLNYDGRVDAGGLTVDSNLTPASGTSVEFFYGGAGGQIQSFDRDNGNLEPLRVRGSTWDLGLDGAASFDGTVDVGDVLNASGGVRSNADGTVFINPASSKPDTATVFQIFKDRSVDSTNSVTFTKEGSASLAGTITAKDVDVTQTASGYTYIGRKADGTATFYVDDEGAATFANTITGSHAIVSDRFTVNGALSSNVNGTNYPFACYDGSSNIYASIDEAGAATFGGNLQAADTKVRLVTSSNHGLVRVLNSSLVDTIFLEGADGSATFKGGVETNSFLSVKTSTTNANYNVLGVTWNGGTGNTYTSRAEITANGNATFGKSGTQQINLRPGQTGTADAIWLENSDNSRPFLVGANGNGIFAGTVTAQGTVLTSDAKFKTDIEPAGSQLSDVVQLGNLLKNWSWNEDAPVSDKDSRFLGLIAQEAEEVSPGIVAELGEGEASYKGIKNDVLVMKLLGAVAELTARVEELESR